MKAVLGRVETMTENPFIGRESVRVRHVQTRALKIAWECLERRRRSGTNVASDGEEGNAQPEL